MQHGRLLGAALMTLVVGCSSHKSNLPTESSTNNETDAGADAGTADAGNPLATSDAGVVKVELDAGIVESLTPCNGSGAYCSKRFSELSYVATHDSAANSTIKWVTPTQDQTLRFQLDRGIRALMLSVQQQSGVTKVCQADCANGNTPFSAVLGDLKDFFDSNPREVVTLFVDSTLSASLIEAEFVAKGLDTLAFTPTNDNTWPTLGELIDQGRRLVVFANVTDTGKSWLLPRSRLVWETATSFTNIPAMQCSRAVGDATAPFYLVHQKLTGSDFNAAPSIDLATQANAISVVVDRLQSCKDEHTKTPNFVAVDFFETGDVVGATQIMNGVRTL